MKLIFAAACETGLTENINQDRIYCGCNGSEGVFLVADGMGGHHEGEKASGCLQEEIASVWEELRGKSGTEFSFEETDLCLKDTLSRTNDRIRENTEKGKLCGTTAVLLHIGEGKCTVFSCGDSRCYAVRKTMFGHKTSCVTKDDEKDGKLLRAVGTETVFTCSDSRLRMNRTVLLALCSDGVHKYVKKQVFLKLLESAADTEGDSMLGVIDTILSKVYRAGAPDNLSLILIRAEPG